MSMYRKIIGMITCWYILAALLIGCGNGQHSTDFVDDADEYVSKGATDARFIDPKLTDSDKLLAIGDTNVELKLQDGQFREMSKSHVGKINAMSGHNFVQLHPNNSITAYQGGYAENAVAMASLFLGTPYEYGSDRTDPSTFDCSDFSRWSYLAALGMDLPKDSRSQAHYIQVFSKRVYWNITEAQRGDLMFFIGYRGVNPETYEGADKSLDNISHVGIFLGDGRMIHTASAATGGVRIDPVTGNHLQYRFVMGGSVLDTK